MTLSSVVWSESQSASANTDTNILPCLNDPYYVSQGDNIRLRNDSWKVVGSYTIINTGGTQSMFTSPLIATEPWRSNAIASGTPVDSVQIYPFPVELARPGDNLQAKYQTSSTSAFDSTMCLFLSNEPLTPQTRPQTHEVFCDISGSSTSTPNSWTDVSLANSSLEDLDSGDYAVLGYRAISTTLNAVRLITKGNELPYANIPARSVNDRIHPLQKNMSSPYPVINLPNNTPVLSVSTDATESLGSVVFYLSRVN